jgi:hypothetical protein
MSIIKLAAFTGESPRTTPRLLPDTGAQVAQSVRLEDGELAPYRKPYPIEVLTGAVAGKVKTIYRHLGKWLWWDKVVHAVPGPVAQDRLYYTGDGKPKMRVNGVVYDLKLTPPAAALTGAVTGTVVPATSATRLYVYTRVTQFGEESEPSPISADIVVSPGNTVTLSGFTSAPAGRGFTKQRIYRSQTGTSGGANLYFIAERDDSAANFTDNIPTDAFNEALPSLDWNPPPDNLQGLVAMPNGIMVGYVGKDLYFCEPYRPHAWPVKYSLATNYDITGLAVSGSTLIVGTKGTPALVGGNSPDTMTMEHVELSMPCLNAQGMVDMGYAILYPSNDGLVMVQGGTPNLISGPLLTRDQWQRLNPATMVCGQFYGRFYASYSYTDNNGDQQQGTIIFDITGSQPYLIRSQHRADAMFYDVTDSRLYMAIGNTVYEWDSLLADNDIMTYRSKAFLSSMPTSFGVILVEADARTDPDALVAAQAARDAVAAFNAAIFASRKLGAALNSGPLNTILVNGDRLKAMPRGPQMAVNVYADDEFVATVTTIADTERLPAVLARQWEVEVTGNIDIQEITMAGTAQELRGA